MKLLLLLEQPRIKGCTQRRAGASVTIIFRCLIPGKQMLACLNVPDKAKRRQSIVVNNNTESHRWQDPTGADYPLMVLK